MIQRESGDIIAIQTSALHSMKKWPGFMESLRTGLYAPLTYIKKFDGTSVGTQELGNPGDPTLVLNRVQLHAALYQYVKDLGIGVTFSAIVEEYFETAESGGIRMTDGRKMTADLVVAADGVGSTSWSLILGYKEQVISSGFAVYRVTFPAKPALENTVIAEEFEGFDNRVSVHVGDGAHVVIGKTPEQICWILTHRASYFPSCLVLILCKLIENGYN